METPNVFTSNKIIPHDDFVTFLVLSQSGTYFKKKFPRFAKVHPEEHNPNKERKCDESYGKFVVYGQSGTYFS